METFLDKLIKNGGKNKTFLKLKLNLKITGNSKYE